MLQAVQSTGMTQLVSGPGRRCIQRVLNGFLVGKWTKGTTGSVIAETWFPGKRKSICPSSASQKLPNKQTLDLGRLWDFCSIAYLVAHTQCVRNARLVLCCLTIKLLFPSWASIRPVQLCLFWLSEERLGAFLGALPGVLIPLLMREGTLDPPLEKSSCRIIFQCPSRHSKLSPKGFFPVAGFKSSCLILVCCSHFTAIQQNCSEKIISSNKSKNFYLSSSKLCGHPCDGC